MTAEGTKWELKMHQARQLRREGAGILYDRVSLLVACYEDKEFQAWHEANGTSDLQFLDDELTDTGLTFWTLKETLAMFPSREDWVKHNTSLLVALAMKAEADRRKREREKSSQLKPKTANISLKEWRARALAAEAECERLRAELASMREAMGVVNVG